MMKQRFYKLIPIGLILIASMVIFTTPIAMAGGWAMVTLDWLPVEPRAGGVLHLGFTVRQHGVTPANTVNPYLFAQNEETGVSIRVNARPEGAVGHFVVDVIIPSAGTWTWGIRSEPFGVIPEQFEPLTVLPALTSPAETTSAIRTDISAISWWFPAVILIFAGVLILAIRQWNLKKRVGATIGIIGLLAMLSATSLWPSFTSKAVSPTQNLAETATASQPNADYGRTLFIAKGCVACHAYSGITHSIPGPVLGPNLTAYSADPAFLRQWLHDPASIRPDTRMPNLGLDEHEIEALIDFLVP